MAETANGPCSTVTRLPNSQGEVSYGPRKHMAPTACMETAMLTRAKNAARRRGVRLVHSVHASTSSGAQRVNVSRV